MAQPILPPQQYYPQIDKSIDPKVTLHFQRIYQWNNNQEAAILALNTKVENLKSSTSSSTAGSTTNVTENVSAAGVTSFNSLTGAVTYFPYLGTLNNQTGNTTYTSASSDNGAIILFDDASAISFTLNSAASTASAYFFFVVNLGAGTVTMTPSSGNVNGGATFALTQNNTSLLVFDGANWWATPFPVVPQNTPAVTHEWLKSYNSATGAFTQTQPSYSDLSGSPPPSAYTPVTATSATSAAVYELILCNTTAAGFTVTLPLSSASTGESVIVKKTSSDSNTLTVATSGGDTIDGAATWTATTQYIAATFMADGAGHWFIV